MIENSWREREREREPAEQLTREEREKRKGSNLG